MYKIAELEQYFVEGDRDDKLDGLWMDVDRQLGGSITVSGPIEAVGMKGDFMIIDHEETIELVYRRGAMGRDEAVKRLLAYYAQTMIENVGEEEARVNLAAIELAFGE